MTLVTDWLCRAERYFSPVMKRLLQSVALAVAAILAVQPALATMTCAQMICADGRSSMECCQHSGGASMSNTAGGDDMASMGTPENGSGQAALPAVPNCFSAPCCTTSAHPAAVLAASVKSQFDGLAPIVRLGALAVAPALQRAAGGWSNAAFSPPQRHVLFQVFRI